MLPALKFQVGGTFSPNTNCGPIRVEAKVGTSRVAKVLDTTSTTLELPDTLPAISTADTFVVDARIDHPAPDCEGELRWDHVSLKRVP